MKKFLFLALIVCPFLIFSGCSTTKPKAKPPASGNEAAGIVYYDKDKSDLKTGESLKAPGNLEGMWVEKGKKIAMTIAQDKAQVGAREVTEVAEKGKKVTRKEKWQVPEDHFLITFADQNVSYPFEATHQGFYVFGCDFDGDGVEEIVLEHGRGRGVSAYIRQLTILKVSKGRVFPVFAGDLGGYLADPTKTEPIAWTRKYHVQKAGSTAMDLVLSLLSPESIPAEKGSLDDLLILQHRHLILKYNAKYTSFEIRQGKITELSELK